MRICRQQNSSQGERPDWNLKPGLSGRLADSGVLSAYSFSCAGLVENRTFEHIYF